MNQLYDPQKLREFFEKEYHQLQADKILFDVAMASSPEVPNNVVEFLNYPLDLFEFAKKLAYQQGYLQSKVDMLGKLIEIIDIDELGID
jgi:hypothetical protein